jgi:hypothetical protein
MNKCFDNDPKFFQAPNAGVCDICNPFDKTPLQKTALCPPIGEPKHLTVLAPAVYDEAGVNLCRVVDIDQLMDLCVCQSNRTTDVLFDGLTVMDLKNADHIQLQVVDIDFNTICPQSCRYSEIKPANKTPNLTRVVLRDIDVTLAVRLISSTCKEYKEGMMTLRYLPSETCPGYDEETNPSNIAFDLYTPYGISYAPENPAGCNKLIPTINYAGFIENQICQCGPTQDTGFGYRTFAANNGIRQGITAQALAKVVAYDEDSLAIGLTLYFKVVYAVQYKVKHEGLCVPPKFTAAGGVNSCGGCLEFVNGDLLEQNISPLDSAVSAKTLGCLPTTK